MAPPISFGSASVLALCVGLWLLPSLFAQNKSLVASACMSPYNICEKFQVWRIYSSAFTHLNFFHIFFNLIAWYFLALDYELKVGTLVFLYDILVRLIPFATAIHISFAYTMKFITSDSLYTAGSCSVGVSGVLFSLLVINLRHESSVSVFGLFNMPAIWYPPALAVVLQFFSSEMSFVGHLTGILAGHALHHPMLEWAKLPAEYQDSWELRLKHLPNWHASPGYLSFISRYSGNSQQPPSFGATVSNARNSVARWFNQGTTTTTQDQSFGQRLGTGAGGASRTAGGAIVSPTASAGGNTAAFSGAGHIVGGSPTPFEQSTSPRTGVPTHSRLLQQNTQPPERPQFDDDDGDNVGDTV